MKITTRGLRKFSLNLLIIIFVIAFIGTFWTDGAVYADISRKVMRTSFTIYIVILVTGIKSTWENR